MRIISRSTLTAFWKKHKDAEQPLKSWYAEARRAKWKTPNIIKEQFITASILKGSRVVFNIAGNKYRLLVSFNYEFALAYIKFIGTHKEYDKIDAETYDPKI
jgi:mRNA interferase HigB